MENTLNIKNNIAANIAFYRKKCKITQKDLASLLKIKNTTVSTWERGASLPDAEMLFEICKIFGISLAEMYGADTITKKHMTLSDDETQIIEKYRRSDEITRGMVLRALSLDDVYDIKGDAEKMG